MATTIQTIELPKKARALDTSGNNNHGQIYSGRGLEFDGVSDHLLTGYGNGLNPYTTPITAVIWAKTSTTGGKIFIGPTAGTNQRFYIGMNDGVWDMGIQNSPWATTTNEVSGFSDQPSYEVDTWYRIVVVMSAGQATMYVNGVKSYAKTYTSYVFNSDITIGNFDPTASFYWNGMLSDAQIWDAAFTQADVTYDYLNPESLALNGGGTALTESNLKLWYPMQDGHRGQQSYILDGANTGLVTELIDADVAYDISPPDTDGWTKYGTNTISNPTTTSIKVTGDGSDGAGMYAYFRVGSDSITNTDLVVGTVYKFTCDFETDDSNAKINIPTAISNLSDTGTGSKVIYFTANSTGSVYVKFAYLSDGKYITLSNISLKPINDKNHATTVFHGDELVSEGDFSGADDGDPWTTPTGWTIGSSKATCASGNASLTQALSITVGRSYRVTVDVTRTSGTLSIDLGGAAAQTTVSTSVGQDFDFVAITTGLLRFYGGSFLGDLDNVSVKEIGVASGWTDADQQLHIPQTALQSYNELAWFEGSDEHVVIADDNLFSFGDGSDDSVFSVSAWVFMIDATNFIIMGKGVSGSTHEWLMYTDSNDKFGFYAFDESASAYVGRSYDTALTSYEGSWVQFAGTYDASEANSGFNIYLNGVQVDDTNFSSGSYTAMENLSAAVHMGRYHTSYSKGSITEASIWSTELSQAEVNELYNDGKALDATTHSESSNLVGYWRNNGLATWTNLDNPGTLDGTPTNFAETILIPQGVDSTRDNQGFIMNKQKDTSCLNLDGIGYAEINDADTLDFGTGDFTMECWVKYRFRNTGSVLNTVMGLGGQANGTTSASINTDADEFLFYVGATNQKSSSALVDGNWYHVVATRTSNTLQLYVDAAAEGGTGTSSQTVTNTDNKNIGQDSSINRPYKHQIDGAKIYSRALSTTEITRNYNATKGSHRN